jgi:hypothetical protein
MDNLSHTNRLASIPSDGKSSYGISSIKHFAFT